MGLLLLGYFLFKSHENGSGVVRLEMAMDFSSKEVEPRLMRELSMDSPRTDLGLLKTVQSACWIKMVHVKLLVCGCLT